MAVYRIYVEKKPQFAVDGGAVLYGCAALADIRRDFEDILRDSAPVQLTDCRTGFVGGMVSALLRVLAPLC